MAQPHILVVEDEPIFRATLKAMLETYNYKVTVASDGRIAKSIITAQAIDCVLSDINMPHMSGLALLKHIKEIHPKLPVVLMTGFSVLEETRQAHELGAEDFIAKPFRQVDLMAILDKIVSPTKVVAKPSSSNISDQFAKVSIEEFITGKGIQFNIFIKVSDEKFVKIACSGEDLSVERIRSYKSKGLHFLHLRKEDYQKYMQMSVNIAKSIQHSSKIDPERKIKFLKHANEVIMEHVFSNKIDEKAFLNAKTVLEATLNVISSDNQSLTLLEALNSHHNSLYAQSIGVSMYGVMLATKMDWRSALTLHKVALAGIFHDIGKKEFETALLLKPRKDYSVADVKLYESHPARGLDILSGIPHLSEDVLQTVMQHHEDSAGTGYPAGLQAHQIHPMAKLISVADQFCSLAIKTANSEALEPEAAVRRIMLLKSATLDKAVLSALAQLFKVEQIVLAKAA